MATFKHNEKTIEIKTTRANAKFALVAEGSDGKLHKFSLHVTRDSAVKSRRNFMNGGGEPFGGPLEIFVRIS